MSKKPASTKSTGSTKSTPREWSIERVSPDAHRLTFDGIKAGWSQWVLLQTDEHWDNNHTDLRLLKRHHEEAVQRNAPILKFGDVFCAMQGKWDRRASQSSLREEHRGDNYLDRLVDTAADWYSPYAPHIALACPGNHEQSIYDRHQTDLLERLVSQLKRSGNTTLRGNYTGYVLLQFRTGGKAARAIKTLKLHYHHGYGGGGEVTRGQIDNNRTRGQYLADIYISGHIHRRNMDENILVDVTDSGKVITRPQIFLRSSTYKDERRNGWHQMQGRAARPLGGWWLKFEYCRTEDDLHDIRVTEMRAT